MKIGVQRFGQHVGYHKNVYKIVPLIEKNYCSYLEMRGLCEECKDCAFYLKDAVQKIDHAKDVRNWRALFVWLLKDARAQVVEDHVDEEAEPGLEELLLQVG